MAKKKDIHIDPELLSELKRLRKLAREHNLLKQEPDLRYSASRLHCGPLLER